MTESIKQSYNRISLLIVHQAQLVDRIDYYLSNAEYYQESANKELLKLYESYNGCAYKSQLFCGGLCVALFFVKAIQILI